MRAGVSTTGADVTDMIPMERHLTEDRETGLLTCTADIVAAFVSQSRAPASQLPELIRSVHGTLASLGEAPPAHPAGLKPAVPVGRSVQNDYIVCLEDGAKLKMLKRYLRTHFNLSPEEYRRKWDLPADYPMVAPAYAKRRSQLARQIGLGRGVRRKG